MVSRLEAELARQLRPAAAPAELWDRIEEAAHPRATRRLGWPVWAFAAALAAAVLLCCFSLRSQPSPVQARQPILRNQPPDLHASSCVLCHGPRA